MSMKYKRISKFDGNLLISDASSSLFPLQYYFTVMFDFYFSPVYSASSTLAPPHTVFLLLFAYTCI